MTGHDRMTDWPAMPLLELVKYHGLGNDFLVLLAGTSPDRAAAAPPGGARLAARLCDRRRGVGADGLIVLTPAAEGSASGPARGGDAVPGRVAMALWNADGSPAETSGNGLRCAALALLDARGAAGGSGDSVTIETLAGSATIELLRRGPGSQALLRVSMGEVSVGEEEGGPFGRRARRVELGNPHLVLYPGPLPPGQAAGSGTVGVEDLLPLALPGGAGDVAGGSVLAPFTRPGGWNVESVTLPPGEPPAARVEMIVVERGAGPTPACGSGSVAVAAALRASGLAGDRLDVANPGGVLTVELDGPPRSPRAWLTGPAQRVAAVEVELEVPDPEPAAAAAGVGAGRAGAAPPAQVAVGP